MLISERSLYKAMKLFGTLATIEALKVITSALRDIKANPAKNNDLYGLIFRIPDHEKGSEPAVKRYRRLHQILIVLVGDDPHYTSLINSLMNEINDAPKDTNWLNNQD